MRLYNLFLYNDVICYNISTLHYQYLGATMHLIIKILLLISLYTISNATEIFVNKEGMKLAHINLSEKYCKSTKNERKLCKTKKLSYIDYADPDLPTFLRNIQQHITPILKAYLGEDLKNSTLADVKDFGADINGDWYNETDINLFSKTPTTYTLSKTSSGYSGGAHGYHAVGFTNYDIKTQKKLTLDDLFLADYNQTLHTIALSHYRLSQGLKPNQTLIDDGWFDNKFMLAKSVAITSRGLYFLYNSYEIKPYAAGFTEFMLPYSKLKAIINPKGALAFALNKTHTFHASFSSENQVSTTIDTQINTDKTITITAKMTNLSYLNKGWLSLSFPQLESKHQVVHIQNIDFKQANTYPKGSKIYHNKRNKAVRSSYVLVEGEDNNWKYKDTHTIAITITPPTHSKELILDIRSALKSQNKSIVLPSEYDGVEGQQGYTNYRVFIGL